MVSRVQSPFFVSCLAAGCRIWRFALHLTLLCPQLLLAIATTEAKIQLLGVRPPVPLLHSGPLILPSPVRPSSEHEHQRSPDWVHLCSPFLLLFTPLVNSCGIWATAAAVPPYARCPGLRRVLRRRGDEHPPPGMRTPIPAIWLFVFGSEPI